MTSTLTGHDIETSWLLTEAAEALGDPEVIGRCRKVALELADASLKEGINDGRHDVRTA